MLCGFGKERQSASINPEMGGGVSKTTLVSKAQAVSAVRAAFDGKPGEATVPLEALVHAALPASAPKPARGARAADAYRTTADEMHQWHREPSVAKKLGAPVHGGSDRLAWKAALESGTLTRDARMTKVRAMFDALDDTDDHTVTEREFVDGLAADGVDPGAARALFKAIDETHTRKISLTKFEHYCSCHTLQIVRDSFKQLDASHDRQIAKKEFVQYFLGNGLSKAQCHALWDGIDGNHNGKISFVEYRDWAQDTLAVTSLEDVAMSLGMSAPE